MSEFIEVINAKRNNLDISYCKIPRNALVIITGPSGSGKSTLLNEVLYYQAQRKFSSMQINNKILEADPTSVTGLSFAIAFREQRINSKATVATLSGLYEYLRLIFFHCGVKHCINCGNILRSYSIQEIIKIIFGYKENQSLTVLSPLGNFSQKQFSELSKKLIEEGFIRVELNDEIISLYELNQVNPDLKITVKVLIDSFKLSDKVELRLLEAVSLALSKSNGKVIIRFENKELIFNENLHCKNCSLEYQKFQLSDFSFYLQDKSCSSCQGKGFCEKCRGSRLKEAVSVLSIGNCSLVNFISASVNQAIVLLSEISQAMKSEGDKAVYLNHCINDLTATLSYLAEVGLGYLKLSQLTNSLSSGELWRVQLARQLGADLVGVTYFFDEPTRGLHPIDVKRLAKSIRKLVDFGNSVILAENDLTLLAEGDYLLELGPGGGKDGGKIIAADYFEKFLKIETFATKYLKLKDNNYKIQPPADPNDNREYLKLEGLTKNNLKDLNLSFPLNALVVITGVSGSGKTSLVFDSLVPGLKSLLIKGDLTVEQQQDFGLTRIQGWKRLKRIVDLSELSTEIQSNRSIVATVIGVFDFIREIFSLTAEAKIYGYGPQNFSFNTSAGACPKCKGSGEEILYGGNLTDLPLVCSLCNGKRFDSKIKKIQYRGYSINDILSLTLGEAKELFAWHAQVHRQLILLCDQGLSYLVLGQSSKNLSLGELQRLRLIGYLGKKSTSSTLFALDEPTRGLHPSEINGVVKLFRRLIDEGSSVLVVDHVEDFIRQADYIIDLGPGPGEQGGKIVASGTLAQVYQNHEFSFNRAKSA